MFIKAHETSPLNYLTLYVRITLAEKYLLKRRYSREPSSRPLLRTLYSIGKYNVSHPPPGPGRKNIKFMGKNIKFIGKNIKYIGRNIKFIGKNRRGIGKSLGRRRKVLGKQYPFFPSFKGSCTINFKYITFLLAGLV